MIYGLWSVIFRLGPMSISIFLFACVYIYIYIYPEGPSTQYLRSQVPNTIESMVFGTRNLSTWTLCCVYIYVYIYILCILCICRCVYIYISLWVPRSISSQSLTDMLEQRRHEATTQGPRSFESYEPLEPRDGKASFTGSYSVRLKGRIGFL